MNNLFFIRHAESEANKSRIMAGHMAFPLTEAGKNDANLIAAELKQSIQIDRIISSPLKRAAQTAESFSKAFNLEIEFDARVTEQHVGRFTGMTYDQVKTESDYEMDSLNRWNWIPAGGGESYEMVAERVTDFLTEINTSHRDAEILIVTHAVTLRLITAALKNTLPEYTKDFPNNGEILKVEFNGLGGSYKIESILLGNSSRFTHNP